MSSPGRRPEAGMRVSTIQVLRLLAVVLFLLLVALLARACWAPMPVVPHTSTPTAPATGVPSRTPTPPPPTPTPTSGPGGTGGTPPPVCGTPSTPACRKPPPPPPPPPVAHTYTVVRHDTLWAIALRLHVVGGWPALYRLNKAAIDRAAAAHGFRFDPHDPAHWIFPGTVLHY